MKGVKKMEGNYVETGVLGNFTLGYFNKVLTPDFTKELMGVFGINSKALIKEFIYGMDLLVELMETEGTPTQRLLNNRDVTDSLVFVMQNKARLDKKAVYFGCSVSARVTEMIDELFEYKYLRLFNFVMSKLRPHLIIPFDGNEYLVTINKTLSVASGHCSLTIRPLNQLSRKYTIPFNHSRLVN